MRPNWAITTKGQIKMRKLGILLGLTAITGLLAFACSLGDLTKGNTSLAREIKKLERQGFVMVEDQSFYNQHRYIVAPTPPYVDGFGSVTMRKSAGNYSLETTYLTITFDGLVKKNGRCATEIKDVTTSTVY